MGIEEELRARAFPQKAGLSSELLRRIQAKDAEVATALERLRPKLMEANQVLDQEGILPARLWSAPDGSYKPMIGYGLSSRSHGKGWQILDNVIVSTDGQLWMPDNPNSTMQRNLTAFKIRVSTRRRFPEYISYQDGRAVVNYSVGEDRRHETTDFWAELKNGYVRFLKLHHSHRERHGR